MFTKSVKILHLSTGFCSMIYWNNDLSKNAFNLLHKIYEKIETFDYEEYFA